MSLEEQCQPHTNEAGLEVGADSWREGLAALPTSKLQPADISFVVCPNH